MPDMSRRTWMLVTLAALCLLAVVAGPVSARPIEPTGSSAASAPLAAPGPSSWSTLPADSPFGCTPVEAGRDGGQSYWAAENGFLHLRLCTAGAPGWQPKGASWADARYKWQISTSRGRFLLIVEDYQPDKQSDDGAIKDPSDGRGEVTLLEDLNGNGRFADDWILGSWHGYVDNAPGAGSWRRAWSSSTGSRQASNQGATNDVGFRLGTGSCGTVIDVYVRLAVLGQPNEACLSWATDAEGRGLDAQPQCDTGPSSTCVPLKTSDVPTATEAKPTATRRLPTVTPTRTSLPPTATPTRTMRPSTATPTRTSRPPTATATRTATATSTATATTKRPTATGTALASVGPPLQTPTNTATATATWTLTPKTATPTATVTLAPSATPTDSAGPPPTITPTATDTPVPPSPTATTVVLPPTATATASQTATATGEPTDPATATPSPTLLPTPGTPGGCLAVCALAIIDGRIGPFPAPAYVRAVLLTPQGLPAKPPVVVPLGADSCAWLYDLEPGLYRVSVDVPPDWTLYPGNPATQTVHVFTGGPCSQVVFRFMPVLCPPPCPPPPPPPGPPTNMPGFSTPTPVGPPPPPGPPTNVAPPTTTPYPVSPDRPAVGALAHLPVLSYLGNDAVCSSWIEAQNIGDRPAKALVLVWGAPGFCPPQCAGPLKVECSGLLRPGSAWNFLGSQMPAGAKSGLVLSANEDPHGNDIFADALCEALFHTVVGNCDEYRRFRKAFDERGRWNGFDFGYAPAQPMAVEVLRDCPGDVRPGVRVTSSYAGVAGEFLGHWDPVYGGYSFFAPSLYAGYNGFTSIMYIQNGGLECTSIELWFKAQDDCLRPRVCDILTLAPGESFQFDASSCMPAGWVGGAWVRSTQPLAIAVDHVGNDVLMTYTGMPGELNYTHNGQPLFTTGSQVAYGPLIYSEYQGWDTGIVVQNLSATNAAKVKVYFLDRSGGVISTLIDWVCPQGSQTFFLPVVAGLPGNWVGSARVESQSWFTPGAPAVSAPNIHAVAQLIQYTDIARTEAQEAIAYNLFPEHLAFDWQVGGGQGGLSSGIGRIGVPSFFKDRRGSGVTSELAIVNLVPKPGLTNFALFIYDQNGLIDYLCETLSSRQVEYIDLANWGFIHPGFKGSAVISATFWEHEVWDSSGGFARNIVGLAAVKIERTGTTLGNPIPGDESAGNIGFPIPGPFPFSGPSAPSCPGQPSGGFPPVP